MTNSKQCLNTPAEQANLHDEVLAVRQFAAYWKLDNLSIISLEGKDAASFLQGRSSNDVKSLKIGDGQQSSLLDRKGLIIAIMSVHRLSEDTFWIISDLQQAPTILQQFTTYHFREQINYRDLSSEYSAISLQGVASESVIQSITTEAPAEEYSIKKCEINGAPVVVLRRSLCGDPGYIILQGKKEQSSDSVEILEKLKTEKAIAISAKAADILRIEAGLPLFGLDMNGDNLLPETGLEQSAASYNKGCFQGQEVLARIKTYGAPRRALVGLIFDEPPAQEFAIDSSFSISGEESGTIKSNCYSPSLEKFIALAYIARDYRVPDKTARIETAAGAFDITVKFLPFYSANTSKIKAQTLYDQALQEFAHGSEEKAVMLLRNVLELNPLFVDAYESLGVILSRHEQYDEAIALMHKLQSLQPDSVMAHTNLSVYYMQLGDKERAEEEKAIAMSIRMSQLAREHAQKKKETEDRGKLLQEAEKRLEMFRQVLLIDPDDFLANNGVGTVYVEIGQYEEAIPYLEKTIKSKPTHTVAYLALGQAFENLAKFAEAINVYRSGIDVAAKRGDITPMKEMQLHLAAAEAAQKK